MGVAEVVHNPRSYLWERGRMYRALLFDPERFYDEFVGDRGLRSEVLTVIFVGIVGSIGTFLAVETIRSEFDAGLAGDTLPQALSTRLWAEALGPLLGAFVLWFALALTLYLVSWAYSTLGGFYTTVKKSAWALVPLAFANLIATIGYIVTALQTDVDTELPTSTRDVQLEFLWSQIGHDPIVLGARAAGLVFAVWAGYIAAHAIADVRDISVRQGYVVAAVPVVLYLVREGLDLLAAA